MAKSLERAGNVFVRLDPDDIRQRLKDFLDRRGLKPSSFVERYHISNETSLRDFLHGKQNSFGTRFERYVLLKHIGVPAEDLRQEFGKNFGSEVFQAFEPFWALCEHFPAELDELEYGLWKSDFVARHPRTAFVVLERLKELEAVVCEDGWLQLDYSVSNWESWIKNVRKSLHCFSRCLERKAQRHRVGWCAKTRVSEATALFLREKAEEFRELMESRIKEDQADGAPISEKHYAVNSALFADIFDLDEGDAI